ncbi:PDR/VanB family oxidoreductase [Rhizobium sp. WYJ-E13]|uniref:PDR/VanB family oxidoreductase n=1 Tax=Rhizobium sp. WYJ-E13 TaxID=2849093 RepID=UPI001C1EDB3B|nr:PDR/VanB family oxidoreductase [Rhizobium sp. WYJ-E13]QWW72385.1 PDR/VanB family oxidoreductase [Rhizobium sp. WYJ-E13]
MSKTTSEAATLRLKVTSKREIAVGIHQFELRHTEGKELPAFTPGSHLTVSLPNGQKRRYSITNPPIERERYVLAVKREINGRGGSVSLVDEVAEGDHIDVSPPANNFEMSAREPRSYLFVAGGIGITPIRSMIYHLLAQGKTNFRLYYFTRSPDLTAFREEFADHRFKGKVVIHHDNGDPEQAFDLWPILGEPRGAHLYCCGPQPLMNAVKDMTGFWSDDALHFEDFGAVATARADDTAFTIRLAASGECFNVEPGVSILDTLRLNGHRVPSSCESGTCGTCRVRFLAGDPEHRDLVLSEQEKKTEIMVCVSRARSDEIVLDI